jgi:hypothetical protein
MLTLADLNHLEVPDQLFSYAEAYRSASVLLCRKVESDATLYTWPHASVVLMLAAHAVELLLKGALLKRKVMISKTHDIQQLAETYRETFPEPTLAWNIPFANPLSEKELIAYMKQEWPEINEVKLRESMDLTPEPSILYRYPVTVRKEKNTGVKRIEEWPGSYGFTTATEFLSTLDQMNHDFKRIRQYLS